MKKGQILSNGFCTRVENWLESHTGNYLEIGAYDGVFVSTLAEKFPDKHFYVIDPFVADGHTGQPQGDDLNIQYENFIHNTSKLPNVTLFKQTTKECLDNLIYKQMDNVSCVLIDGSHHYEDVLVDFKFTDQLELEKESLLVVDDLHISDVGQAIQIALGLAKEDSKLHANHIPETDVEKNYQYFILTK